MKRPLIVLILGLLLTGAAVVNADNLMKQAALDGPYSNLGAISDGKVTEQGAITAVSDTVGDKSLRLKIDLGAAHYLKEIIIHWDNEGIPRNFDLWLSRSGVDNTVMSAFDGTTGSRKGPVTVQTIPLNTAFARYVTLFIPVQAQLSSGRRACIREIEIVQEKDPKLVIESVEHLATDKEIFVMFKTNIDAQSEVYYAEDSWEGSFAKPLRFLFPRTSHSNIIYGLKPDAAYKFKVKALAPNIGKESESKLVTVKTRKKNLAYKQPAVGTFTNLPDDKYVKKEIAALDRLTDGGNDYFSSMAQSGSIRNSDQYVVIDLWKEYPLDLVVCNWWALSYPRSYSLQISKDGKTWEDAATGIDAYSGISTEAGAPMNINAIQLNGKKARFVRIYIPKGSPFYNDVANFDKVSLFEIKIFGGE